MPSVVCVCVEDGEGRGQMALCTMIRVLRVAHIRSVCFSLRVRVCAPLLNSKPCRRMRILMEQWKRENAPSYDLRQSNVRNGKAVRHVVWVAKKETKKEECMHRRSRRRRKKCRYAHTTQRAFISWRGYGKLKDLLKWMNMTKQKYSFRSFNRCVVFVFLVHTTNGFESRRRRSRMPRSEQIGWEGGGGVRMNASQTERPYRTRVGYKFRANLVSCSFVCCCFFFVSVHDSSVSICKPVHMLNSFVLVLFCFVCPLFSQRPRTRGIQQQTEKSKQSRRERILRIMFCVFIFFAQHCAVHCESFCLIFLCVFLLHYTRRA